MTLIRYYKYVSLFLFILSKFLCLFCTRCLKERQRKVNLSHRISYALRFSFSLMYSNTQFCTKHSLNLGLRQKIADTVTLKHSKWLMHVKRAYVSY